MSFGEYFQAFGSLGDAYREAQDRADQKKWQEEAAGLAGKQLDLYLQQQGAQTVPALPGLGQPQETSTGALPPLGAASTPRLPSFADASGSGGDYISNLFRRESGNNPNARPSTSGAAGLGQFIPKTWNGIVRSHRELGLTPITPGAPDPRKDEQQMIAATKALTADNEAVLAKQGLPINDATRYSLHFLGATGGPKFVAGALSNPNAPAVSFVGADQAAANRNVFFNKDGSPKSAGQVLGSFDRSFGGGGSRVAQAPVAVPTFGARSADTADAGPAMQMPGVISNPPMPPQRPVQMASADPDSVPLPANAAAGYQSPHGPSGGPDPVAAPQPVAPVRPMQLPTSVPGVPSMVGQPPQALIPQSMAGAGIPGTVMDRGNPVAQVGGAPAPVAGLQPPPTQLPQQSVVAPRPAPVAAPAATEAPFVPGQMVSPPIQPGRLQDVPPVQGAPRMTPQQAQFLRAQLANPLTRPQAIQTIQGLGTPDKWETKELGGRVVQTNGRGDVRLVPGFDKPDELEHYADGEGNQIVWNKKTGAQYMVRKAPDKSFTDVTDPAARAAANIPGNLPAQRGPNNELKIIGIGQQGLTPQQQIETTEQKALAEARVKDVLGTQEAGKDAGKKLQTYAQLANAWDNANGSIYTGPGADTVLKAKQIAGAFGIPIQGTPETEIVSKVGTQLAAITAKDLTTKPTQFDFRIMLENNPGLLLSEAGNRAMINLGQQQAKIDLGLAHLASKYKPGDDWNAMREAYLANNPIRSPLTGKPLDPNELISPQFGPQRAPGQQAAGGIGGQQGAQLRPMSPDLVSDARRAIASGVPAAAVIERLRAQGHDPSALSR